MGMRQIDAQGIMMHPLKLTALLLFFAGLSMPGCISRSEYPPIRTDSVALAAKADYLQHLSQESNNYSGPNIIIILADDLGKNEISLYDSHTVRTPHIDQLAEEGIYFTEAYSTSSVCNPSRAGLLTGRYQQRFGNGRQIMGRYARNNFELFIFKNFINTRPLYLIDPQYSPSESEMKKQGLPESEISLFEIMHSVGYKTACIGKWHLGYNEPFLPQNKGIDEFFGFYEAFSLYAPTENEDIVNHRHKSFQDKVTWRQERKGPSAIIHNGVEINDNEYLTNRIAEEASRFIKQNKEYPFLLYIPFSAPHTPFQAPKSYYEKYTHVKDENKRIYYAMISALDDAVGQIIEQVKASGIEDNTLIIFSSDNGGATYTGACDNGNLKGGKMTHFEGGLNIPLIIKWKDTLTPGGMYHEPVSLMDVFTTAITSCNIPRTENRVVDGVDLIPYLTGEKSGSPHEYLFWRTDFSKTVRSDKWKLIVNSRDSILLLYDLEADKQEEYDLKTQYPAIVKHLLSQLAEWETELKPPLWPGVMEYGEEFNGEIMRFAF